MTMTKLLTKVAVIALLGSMAAPAFAAPPTPGGQGPDCANPQNANTQFCPAPPNGSRGRGMRPSRGDQGNGPAMGNPNSNGSMGDDNNNRPMGDNRPVGQPPRAPNGNPPSPPGAGLPPGSGQGPGPGGFPHGFPHRPHDNAGEFRNLFRGFGYGLGMFAAPNFGVQIGVGVPHSYRLREVPRSIWRYYPEYRGYLFFVNRNGAIVIVNPRTYRIIDII